MNYKISNLRAFAILTVVIGHSIILYSSEWTIYETSRECVLLDSVKAVINLYQMQLFFLISGFLFHGTNKKNINFKEILTKKFQRLIMPYFIFGLLWMIPIKAFVNCPGYNITQINDVIRIIGNLITGQSNGHLWFLYSLFSVFVLELFCCKLTRESKWANLVLLFVFLLLSHVFRCPDYLNLPATLMYVPWFHLGYFLSMTKDDRWQYSFVIIFAAISLLYHNMAIIYSMLIVLCIYYAMPDCYNRVSAFIDRHSFGVYLLHSPLIYITFTYFAESNPIIVTAINFFVFGTIALVLSVFAKLQDYVKI